jgi:hypothetical protein
MYSYVCIYRGVYKVVMEKYAIGGLWRLLTPLMPGYWFLTNCGGWGRKTLAEKNCGSARWEFWMKQLQHEEMLTKNKLEAALQNISLS